MNNHNWILLLPNWQRWLWTIENAINFLFFIPLGKTQSERGKKPKTQIVDYFWDNVLGSLSVALTLCIEIGLDMPQVV